MKYSIIGVIILCLFFACTNNQKTETAGGEKSVQEIDTHSGKQAVKEVHSDSELIAESDKYDDNVDAEKVKKKETETEKTTPAVPAVVKEKADLKTGKIAEKARIEAEKQAEIERMEAERIKAELKAKETAENEKIEAEKRAKEISDKTEPAPTVPESKPAEELVKKEEPKIKAPTAESILKKVDKNMSSKSTIVTSEMVIHGKRKSRTVTSKGYAQGNDKSFTEYLSPAREKGTKMLKLEDRLWIYSPSTDRTIQLSGHMLKQSVMGSDLSYEDMMDDRKLLDVYNAKVVGEETLAGRNTWVLELIAKVEDASYEKRKTWIDQERFIPLKEELFAKSGQLLKKTILSDVAKIQGRWFPRKMNYKDMLKTGKGTDFIFKKIEFNPEIPAYIFSKASLKQ